MVTAVAVVSVSGLALPPLAAAASPAAAVRAVYRTVLAAEYFGPASAVCGNLTAAGIRAFTAAASGRSCTAAYDQLHHTLHHKQPDNDNSGYTAKAYRTTVATFMAHLKISVRGMRASRWAVTGASAPTHRRSNPEIKVERHAAGEADDVVGVAECFAVCPGEIRSASPRPAGRMRPRGNTPITAHTPLRSVRVTKHGTPTTRRSSGTSTAC
jgi:hypothetical protein